MDAMQKITDKVYLQNCINLFAQRKRLQNIINEKFSIINRNNEFLKRRAGYTTMIFCFTMSIVFIVVSLVAYFVGTGIYGADYEILYNSTAQIFNPTYNGFYWFNVGLAGLALIFLVSGILCIFTSKRKIKKLKEMKILAKQANEEVSSQINYYCGELQKVEQLIYNLDIIHMNYWYAGDYILEYIILGRASNIMEAINLFEHECQVNMQLQQNLQLIQASEKIHNQLIINGLISVANASAIVGSVNSAASRVSSSINSLRY